MSNPPGVVPYGPNHCPPVSLSCAIASMAGDDVSSEDVFFTMAGDDPDPCPSALHLATLSYRHLRSLDPEVGVCTVYI